MVILGIDPGLRNMGWGVIAARGNHISHLGNGVCRSNAAQLPERLSELFTGLQKVIAHFAPETAAVEQTFVNKDAQATLKLGQARGVALLAPALAGLPVGEYAANQIKKNVVGVGHADKAQIMAMVKLQLPGADIAGPDAADALAIALCHAHFAKAQSRIDRVVEAAR